MHESFALHIKYCGHGWRALRPPTLLELTRAIQPSEEFTDRENGDGREIA